MDRTRTNIRYEDTQASLAGLAEKERRKQLNKAFGKKIGTAALVATLMQFWFAQLVIWGLSMYGIHSGIWAPWLIMEGVSSLGVATVAIGMMRAVRDFQNVRP